MGGIMERKNIFDIVGRKKDFAEEIKRLECLLTDKNGIVLVDFIEYNYSIEEFVDKYAFKYWKARGTFINLSDLFDELNIDDLFQYVEPIEKDLLLYLEYVANVLFLVDKARIPNDASCYGTDIKDVAEKNLSILLEWLNYEQNIDYDSERVILVKKNVAAESVAEIVNDDLATLILQYNHFMLEGDLDSKKSILLDIGQALEPLRDNLKQCNKALETNIFFMLNNLNIRHNNRSKTQDSKHYKEYVAKMRKDKLEAWYDDLYQMMLLAYLEMDGQERTKRVDELKKKINTTNMNEKI